MNGSEFVTQWVPALISALSALVVAVGFFVRVDSKANAAKAKSEALEKLFIAGKAEVDANISVGEKDIKALEDKLHSVELQNKDAMNMIQKTLSRIEERVNNLARRRSRDG